MTDLRVLVVGVGSELRRDDGVGRVVAETIEARRLPGVTVRSVTQLVPELVEAMVEADRVIFIDAAVSSKEVIVRKTEPRQDGPTSHHGDPGTLLRLADLIGGPVPEAYTVSVPVLDLGLGTGLTPFCRSQVAATSDTVEALITQAFEPDSSPEATFG